MKQSKFFGILISISTVLAAFFLWLNRFPQFSVSQYFTWGILAFFILLTLAIYYVGKQLAVSNDKYAYNRLILLVVMTKMMLCVLFVVVYIKEMEPTNKFFLIPFFLIYFVYTIFEVVIMTKLGHTKLSTNDKIQ